MIHIFFYHSDHFCDGFTLSYQFEKKKLPGILLLVICMDDKLKIILLLGLIIVPRRQNNETS